MPGGLVAAGLAAGGGFRGLFLILVARGKARVWEVQRTETTIRNLRRKEAFVNHYFFHILDAEWGHLSVRVCGHPPFPAAIFLNGHEWVERRARQEGVCFEKEGNCFTEANAFADLDQHAETLSSATALGRLAEVVRRWLRSTCLRLALSREEQGATGFHYSLSCYQLEYSRNLVFQHGTDVDRLFQRLIDRTRTQLDVKTLTTLFGAKKRPYKHRTTPGPAPRLQRTLERPTHDLTVLKLHFGALTLKVYDKGERVLRIEAIAHNVKALRHGRVLAQLPALVAQLQGMAIRFLEVLQVLQAAQLDTGILEGLAQPSQVGARRLAGLDLRAPRLRAVLRGLLALGPAPEGFRAQHLWERVRAQTGWSEEHYSPRQARYDLAKLRGKGVVARVGRSRRYQPALGPYQTVSAALLLHEQVFTPVLAGVRSGAAAENASPLHPLDQHYDSLRRALLATMQAVGIAA